MHCLYMLSFGLLCAGSVVGVRRSIECAENGGGYVPVFADVTELDSVASEDQTVGDDMMDAITSLSSKVDMVNRRIGMIFTQCSRANRPTRRNPTGRSPHASLGDCEVEDSGRCYWLVNYETRNTTMLAGYEICQTRPGGKPATILSSQHYEKVVNLMRTKIQKPRFYSYVWTGMRINQQTKIVTTGDGNRARFVKWYASSIYPISHSKYTHLYIYTDVTRASGLMNFDPDRPTNGVLCEVRG